MKDDILVSKKRERERNITIIYHKYASKYCLPESWGHIYLWIILTEMFKVIITGIAMAIALSSEVISLSHANQTVHENNILKEDDIHRSESSSQILRTVSGRRLSVRQQGRQSRLHYFRRLF